MKNFLDNILDFDEFDTAFTLLYQKTREEFYMFVIDLKQIERFQPSQFEEVEDEYCTEQEVKDYVKEAYLKFQKFEE